MRGMHAHAEGLLEQADHLVQREARRPRQVSLRRAVSAAYYGVFHMLVRDASWFLVRGGRLGTLRSAVARAFSHAQMKRVAQGFGAGSPAAPLRLALDRRTISSDLGLVCDAFVRLQEARHVADYDLDATFRRSTTEFLVSGARQAVSAWQRVRDTDEARVFLVGLFAADRMRS